MADGLPVDAADVVREPRQARVDLLADAATEARQSLRMLMRCDDNRIILAAAVNLLKVRQYERAREAAALRDAHARGKVSSDPQQEAFDRFLDGISDEEMRGIARRFLEFSDAAQPVPECLPAAPVTAAPLNNTACTGDAEQSARADPN